MNFEEALKNELNSITDLVNKVYPLAATEGVKAPYLVYVSSEGVQEKSLDGYIGAKEVDCELHILNDNYSGLKDITRQVITLVESFPARVIGGNGGVHVQDMKYERPTEQYIPELFQYVCIIRMTVRLGLDSSVESPTWSQLSTKTWTVI